MKALATMGLVAFVGSWAVWSGCGGGATAQCLEDRECVNPDAPACVDANTLRSYPSTGSCLHGKCTYTPKDTPCAQGCDASNRTCKGCTNGCSQGDQECQNGQLRSCSTDGNGCRQWSAWSACPSKLCTNPTTCQSCIPKGCTALGKQCGTWDNGCDGKVTCNECASDQTCSSAGLCEGGSGPEIKEFYSETGRDGLRIYDFHNSDGPVLWFVAMVADPNGVEDVLGGVLKDDTDQVVQEFSKDPQAGKFTNKVLVWDLRRVGIPRKSDETITFTAVFHDKEGHTANRATSVRVYCDASIPNVCNAQCMDIKTNKDNCGTCGNQCRVDCLDGACVSYDWSEIPSNKLTAWTDCNSYCGSRVASTCVETCRYSGRFSGCLSNEKSDCLYPYAGHYNRKDPCDGDVFGTCGAKFSGNERLIWCCCQSSS